MFGRCRQREVRNSALLCTSSSSALLYQYRCAFSSLLLCGAFRISEHRHTRAPLTCSSEPVSLTIEHQVLSSNKVDQRSRNHERFAFVSLGLALAGAIAIWLIPIRTPLWFDETISYWETAAGLREIWSRQPILFPAYAHIFWLTKTIFGSGEVTLRLPSVFAMLAAAAVLYRIAREFFTREISLIATVIFALHPIVSFAAIDARPYAFGVLAVNCAIYSLLLWRRRPTLPLAIALGLFSALIFYFHLILSVVLAALALLLFFDSRREKRPYAQLVWSFAVFALLMVPVVPRLARLFDNSAVHVYQSAPTIVDFAGTFAPEYLFMLLGATALLAAAVRKFVSPSDEPAFTAFACLTLAVVPLGILFLVSKATPVHVFVQRYRICAVPGIALCWALLLSRIDSRLIRIGFCFAALATFAAIKFDAPTHLHSWRDATLVVNRYEQGAKVPVLVCSELPESNFEPPPSDPLNSASYAQFSYYKLSAPIVPLPRSLNDRAKNQIQRFLANARPAHEPFLVMGWDESLPTLNWINQSASEVYSHRLLGVFDGIWVVEYAPLPASHL